MQGILDSTPIRQPPPSSPVHAGAVFRFELGAPNIETAGLSGSRNSRYSVNNSNRATKSRAGLPQLSNTMYNSQHHFLKCQISSTQGKIVRIEDDAKADSGV
ncbi:hypothetical protein WN51_01139 [Melipona quadrifasciata]|uniref:Uncharacterized protein n=1 Tax=Melipona quadrifasciata TaxID=166423 RepID=A0A0N1ITI9_9HYME|nr:hypothetical protein WN51_01139 [Melipona quadrifasciata]